MAHCDSCEDDGCRKCNYGADKELSDIYDGFEKLSVEMAAMDAKLQGHEGKNIKPEDAYQVGWAAAVMTFKKRIDEILFPPLPQTDPIVPKPAIDPKNSPPSS